MTGITKDELMQMARYAGFQTAKVDWLDGSDTYPLIRPIGENCNVAITKLIDIVLERAAVECGNQADRFMQGSPLEGSKPYASHECAAAIRALKINTGD